MPPFQGRVQQPQQPNPLPAVPPSFINTGYGGGGITSTVQVPGAPIFNSGLDQLLLQALRRPAGERAPRPEPVAPIRTGPTEKAPMSGVDAAEANARIAQAKALSEPPPMRSVRGGPGVVGGVGTRGLELD